MSKNFIGFYPTFGLEYFEHIFDAESYVMNHLPSSPEHFDGSFVATITKVGDVIGDQPTLTDNQPKDKIWAVKQMILGNVVVREDFEGAECCYYEPENVTGSDFVYQDVDGERFPINGVLESDKTWRLA